jgi:hypothetical protein
MFELDLSLFNAHAILKGNKQVFISGSLVCEKLRLHFSLLFVLLLLRPQTALVDVVVTISLQR